MEQQNQQSIQGKTESKPPIKTNWKYIAIVVVAAILATGGILLLRESIHWQTSLIFFGILFLFSFLIAKKRANRLVSKESARSILKKHKFSAVFTGVVFVLVLVYFQFSLFPALNNLHNEFNDEKSLLLEFAPYAIFIGILALVGLSLYVLFSKSIEREFDEKLSRYKDGEKIKIRELYTKRLNWAIYLILILSAVIIAIFIILPVYMSLWSLEQKYAVKPLSGEYTVPGIVTEIDTSRMAVDGDGFVTLQTDWGQLVVAIPSGERVCSADISDFSRLQIGDRVEVAGQFTDSKAIICESPRHFLKRIGKIDISINSTALTAGWQTYRNDEFGFEVRYPSGWQVKGSGVENTNTGSDFGIIKNNNPESLTLDEWFRQATLINGRPTVKAGAKPIIVNGIKAYRVDSELPPPAPYFEIVAVADSQRNIFSIYTYYTTTEDANTLDQILSTFRFVEIEARDWETPLDIAKCKSGEKRDLYHGLGSKTIEVNGIESNECVFEYTNGTEGAYILYECRIPTSYNTIDLSQARFYQFCKEIKSGNLLLEMGN